MSQWNPKGLWDELLRSLRGPDEDDDRSADPNLLFHLLVITPLVIGILAMVRRAA